MDILCTRCGEPWDVYSLVDDMTSQEARKLKAGGGCPCCTGKDMCENDINCEECEHWDDLRFTCMAKKVKNCAPESSLMQAAIADIFGDDIDGLAASMDDFGLI